MRKLLENFQTYCFKNKVLKSYLFKTGHDDFI